MYIYTYEYIYICIQTHAHVYIDTHTLAFGSFSWHSGIVRPRKRMPCCNELYIYTQASLDARIAGCKHKRHIVHVD